MESITNRTSSVYWKHTIKYTWSVVLLLVAVVLSSALETIGPLILRELFDALTTSDSEWSGQENKLLAYLLVLGIITISVNAVRGYAIVYNQPRIMSDLYNSSYRYVIKHSHGFFVNNFNGSIVSRIRRYQGSFERVMDAVSLELLGTSIHVLLVLGMMFTLGSVFVAVAAVWVVFYVWLAYRVALYRLPIDIKTAGQDSKISAHLSDTISNSINLKLYASHKKEYNTFVGLTNKLRELRCKSWTLAQHAEVIQAASMVVLQISAMYYVKEMVKHDQMTVGDLVLLQGYLAAIFFRLWNIGRSIKSVYQAFADANEMTVMLDEPHKVVDVPKAVDLAVSSGVVEFWSVCFGYHDTTDVFEDFCLRVEPGQKVALVGVSGSGKSTLINLLLRFEDVRSGCISIDGQNISQVTQDSLRTAIAYVPQDPSLFHRSLMENIRYSRESATDVEVIEAAKAAYAHEFISKFPLGYDTLVGERGVKLSGGEKQRVAIARAILQNAPILVLDEATSSLDYESEYYIQTALRNLVAGKTTIVIAHRLPTIREVDHIVVMEDGRIIEQGSHEQLLASSGTYRRLWSIQVEGFASTV